MLSRRMKLSASSQRLRSSLMNRSRTGFKSLWEQLTHTAFALAIIVLFIRALASLLTLQMLDLLEKP